MRNIQYSAYPWASLALVIIVVYSGNFIGSSICTLGLGYVSQEGVGPLLGQMQPRHLASHMPEIKIFLKSVSFVYDSVCPYPCVHIQSKWENGTFPTGLVVLESAW